MLRLKGFVPSSQWLERDITPPTHEELIRLCLSPTDKVARLKRLRKADDTVMAIEMTTMPAAVLPNPQVVGSSLYEYLEGIGKPIVRALQHIQAINASDEFAKLVGIAPGTAMLLMTRVGYTADNTPIEITDTYCRNDYYDFVAELRRYDFAAELRP
jgi:GntR family transcriptional regulator